VRILLTGAEGLLARALRAQQESWAKVIPLTRPDLDITNRDAVAAAVRQHRPDVVLNCAAFSLVDAAESDPVRAYAVNAVGPLWLAEACAATSARLVHISTDYVFDGASRRPYREDDAVGPLNVYGRSKLASELAVRDALPTSLIVRTQWLFGAGGRSFITSILARARAGEALRVVNDQTGSPTFAPDLAAALLSLIRNEASGIVHVSNRGAATWYDVAIAACADAGVHASIEPCSTAEFPRPATRPVYSVLDNGRFQQLTGRPMRDWQAGVREFLAEPATSPR
jgi:dTDP-4-dehydrorhamnose reductase